MVVLIKIKKIRSVIEETKNRLLYSVPYKPKTNAIESWFSQFKHYFVQDKNAISFSDLKKVVKKSMRKISKKSYQNYIKYAYEIKTVREYKELPSTRRKHPKVYKK